MTSPNFLISQIQIPEAIEIQKTPQGLTFTGPLGVTTLNLKNLDPQGLIGFRLDVNQQVLEISTQSKSLNGLVKTLVTNKIQGVSRGFLVCLKILGIGYRVSLENTSLLFKLGYSHDILYTLPRGVRVFLGDATTLYIFGIEKNQVTQLASTLRELRKPSVYKGKGIRYSDEIVATKAGKRK